MTTSNSERSISYEQVLEALGDAVVISDRNGVVRFWNTAAERLFGFTKTEALGSSLDLIIPDLLRARHWAGFDKVMQSGETHYAGDVLRVPAVHKDGRPLSIAFTVGLLFGPQREVPDIVAVLRDDTQRFAQERTLRRIFAEEDELRNALAKQ